MVKKRVTICLVCVVVGLMGCVLFGADKPAKTTDKPKVVVGTFDSRAVACAWIRSKANEQRIKQIQAEYKKAEANGDKKLMDQLVEEQLIAHKQVFSNEPIDDVLERIKDKLPKIASDAGVDILISKWEIAYENKSARYIDVTWEMVNLCEPDEATVKVIKSLLKQKPVPAEELKHDH